MPFLSFFFFFCHLYHWISMHMEHFTLRRHASQDICLESLRTGLGYKFKLHKRPDIFLSNDYAKTSPHISTAQGRSVFYYWQWHLMESRRTNWLVRGSLTQLRMEGPAYPDWQRQGRGVELHAGGRCQQLPGCPWSAAGSGHTCCSILRPPAADQSPSPPCSGSGGTATAWPQVDWLRRHAAGL